MSFLQSIADRLGGLFAEDYDEVLIFVGIFIFLFFNLSRSGPDPSAQRFDGGNVIFIIALLAALLIGNSGGKTLDSSNI